MPSRKKLKDKGKGKQKKEMRQLANATAAEIIRGIHDGKQAATLALMRQMTAAIERGEDQFDLYESAGIIEAMLKTLKRCNESLASVFGAGAQDHPPWMIPPPVFCLSTLLTGATQSHNRQEVCREIAEGISPVMKCMVHERRVFFQSTETWFDCESMYLSVIYCHSLSWH